MAATCRRVGATWLPKPIPGGGQAFKKNILIYPGQWDTFSPFLMGAEDWIKAPGGFEMHPHRGFETITICWEGELHHEDSRGGRGVLRAGDWQWMTAGRGIVHSEMPAPDGTVCHAWQLWLNLPRAHKLMAPRYQDVRGAECPRVTLPGGGSVTVYAGAFGGATSPTLTVGRITALLVDLPTAAAAVEVPLPGCDNCLVLGAEGQVVLDGDGGDVVVRESGVARLPPTGAEGDTSTVSLRGPGRAVLLAGAPLTDPVVQYGPFVMCSQAEIQQAFSDYQAGRLGYD